MRRLQRAEAVTAAAAVAVFKGFRVAYRARCVKGGRDGGKDSERGESISAAQSRPFFAVRFTDDVNPRDTVWW